jgi:hypothetical protein
VDFQIQREGDSLIVGEPIRVKAADTTTAIRTAL